MSGNERGPPDAEDADMESPAIPKRSNEELADGDADGGNPMDYPPAKRQKHAYSPHAAEKIVPVSRQPKALKSVLKVFIVRADPNYAQPWQMRPQRSGTGSAFITDVQKRRIMTNAHVTSNANTVHVRRPGNPKKWRARVLCEAKVCDLSLLTVDEDDFWAGDLMPLAFVDVPQLQDEILVAGYPQGGDSLSITKGIVSRVVMTRYAHSSNKLLGIQIDAAINPGNSVRRDVLRCYIVLVTPQGGPAFSSLQHGRVAGVAFSKLMMSDNIGYIIPYAVIQHFMEEFEVHGSFRGCCALGFRYQDMENKHLRESLKMSDSMSGSLVFKLEPLAPAAAVLAVNDVVLAIEEVPIADDGTIEFRDEERVDFAFQVRSKHIGDQLRLRVLRDGHVRELSYEVTAHKLLVPTLHGVDGCTPTYFTIAGLIFVPLSIPFLEHAYGGTHWRRLAPINILALVSEHREFEDQQVVVLFQILAAEINFGYKFQTAQCVSFNGADLRNIRQLAEMVDGCKDRYMTFELEGGKKIVLDAEQARRDGPTVLRQHGIVFDRSQDLRETTHTAQVADGAGEADHSLANGSAMQQPAAAEAAQPELSVPHIANGA